MSALLFFASLALASVDPALRPALEQGQVLLLPRSGETVRAMALVPAAPARIWEIVSDPAHLRASSPSVRELMVRQDAPGPDGLRTQRLGYRVKVGLGEVRYNVVRVYDPAKGEMRWSLDPSEQNDIKATDGRFVLRPDESGQTLFQYELRVDTGKPVPGFIQAELSEAGIKSFLQYVQRVAAGG